MRLIMQKDAICIYNIILTEEEIARKLIEICKILSKIVYLCTKKQ
jgi:hypothetical protein